MSANKDRKRSSPKMVNGKLLSPLIEASSEALIEELRRRSIGCVIAVVLIGPKGDIWHFGSKGSPPMLESLCLKLERRLLHDEEEGFFPLLK